MVRKKSPQHGADGVSIGQAAEQVFRAQTGREPSPEELAATASGLGAAVFGPNIAAKLQEEQRVKDMDNDPRKR
jgi:hypothetical protein